MVPPGYIYVGILSPDASAQALHQTEALLLRPSLLVDSHCCNDHEPAVIHNHLTCNVAHKHDWMLSTSLLTKHRSNLCMAFQQTLNTVAAVAQVSKFSPRSKGSSCWMLLSHKHGSELCSSAWANGQAHLQHFTSTLRSWEGMQSI